MRSINSIASGKNPIIAAALSFVIPGAGQMYVRGFRGGFVVAVLWLVIVTIGYIFLFVPGLIFHVVCVFTAYHSAPSSDNPILGALLAVLVLFGGVIGAYYYFLPSEAQNAFSFIANGLKNPGQLANELDKDMESLMVDMDNIASSENVANANRQIVIEMLKNYANAEKRYKGVHNKYTRSTQALVDEGFLELDIPMTNNSLSSFYYGGYQFVHVKEQHTGYVDLKTGFVISAAPMAYKQTGVSTYVVGPTGDVLSKDIEGNPVKNTAEIDASWESVE